MSKSLKDFLVKNFYELYFGEHLMYRGQIYCGDSRTGEISCLSASNEDFHFVPVGFFSELYD